MSSPTRFTKVGLSGNDRGDSDAYKKIFRVPIAVVASAAAQVTAVVLPARFQVVSCSLNVLTAEATGTTKTIDVGFDGGTGAELGNNLNVAATGFVAGLAPVGAGNTITYTLGSADYAELKAELLVEVIASDGG